MTTTTPHNGRLGNQIIRNLAVSQIAEKFNLSVSYSSHQQIQQLGIPLFSGENLYGNIVTLNDNNYFDMLHSKQLLSNLNPNDSYFQTKEITNYIHAYLHSEKVKERVMTFNPYKDRYNNNNDVCIHIRLTDAEIWSPSILYYIKTLNKLIFDNIFIVTDNPNHKLVQLIIKKYPCVKVMEIDEVHTIQFASTCKNIILSHGSFSAVIGYLAFFSNIYYPSYKLAKKMWFGDMFSIEGWKEMDK